jgi:hypothetical protein
MRSWIYALLTTGCGFTVSPGGPPIDDAQPGSDAVVADMAIDVAPITCGDLTCDGHAVCLDTPARCECMTGYTGDGMTCADVNECAVANGGCPGACANTNGSFACYVPTTCNEIAMRVPGFTAGMRTLYFGGNTNQPWTASCEGSGANWREYLQLTGANYSQYTADGQGTSVRTTFTRIRIIPATAKIDIADQTHSTSTGSLSHSGTTVTSMPYAVAMDCAGNNQNTGVARLDLGGTPFVITDPFALRGSQPDGAVTSTNNGRQVSLTGGGNCGWMAPAPAPFNPFNQITGGDILDIAYAP